FTRLPKCPKNLTAARLSKKNSAAVHERVDVSGCSEDFYTILKCEDWTLHSCYTVPPITIQRLLAGSDFTVSDPHCPAIGFTTPAAATSVLVTGAARVTVFAATVFTTVITAFGPAESANGSVAIDAASVVSI